MPRFRHSWSYLGVTLFLCFLLADCVKGECQLPPSKTGLELTEESAALDTFDEGSSVTFQCGIGYTRVSGSGKIFCNHGEWTVESLKCEKKSCGSPGELINGRFSTPDGTVYGATAYAYCNRGYEMHGTAYRQCFDFGWNNRVPLCEIKKCEDPPTIVNGRISSGPDKEFPEFRDIVQYTCDKNYNLVGDSQLVCNEFGLYNGTVPQCKELNCPTPRIENARRVEGGPPPYKLKYYVVYRCNEGYVMEGSSKLVCEATGWSSDFPTCNKVLLPTPPVPTKPAATTTRRTDLPKTDPTSGPVLPPVPPVPTVPPKTVMRTMRRTGLPTEPPKPDPRPGPESTVLRSVPPVPTVPPKTARTTTRRTGLATEPPRPGPDSNAVVIGSTAGGLVGVVVAVGIAVYIFKKNKSEYLTGEDTRKSEGEMPLSPKAHTNSFA